jgi:uncharacterized protein YciI
MDKRVPMSEAPDSAEALQAEIDALQAKMLKRAFFVMYRSVVDPQKFRRMLPDHLRWLMDLEDKGLIFASGPAFKSDDTAAPGMTIFRARNFQHAEELAASDPVCLVGAATFHIHRWMVGAGRVSVSVDFSDQTYRFD